MAFPLEPNCHAVDTRGTLRYGKAQHSKLLSARVSGPPPYHRLRKHAGRVQLPRGLDGSLSRRWSDVLPGVTTTVTELFGLNA